MKKLFLFVTVAGLAMASCTTKGGDAQDGATANDSIAENTDSVMTDSIAPVDTLVLEND